jgi:hypothetical protein
MQWSEFLLTTNGIAGDTCYLRSEENSCPRLLGACLATQVSCRGLNTWRMLCVCQVAYVNCCMWVSICRNLSTLCYLLETVKCGGIIFTNLPPPLSPIKTFFLISFFLLVHSLIIPSICNISCTRKSRVEKGVVIQTERRNCRACCLVCLFSGRGCCVVQRAISFVLLRGTLL